MDQASSDLKCNQDEVGEGESARWSKPKFLDEEGVRVYLVVNENLIINGLVETVVQDTLGIDTLSQIRVSVEGK